MAKRKGRKPLRASEGRVHLAVYVTQDQLRGIDAEAERRGGIKRSQVVSTWIHERLTAQTLIGAA